MAEGRSGRSRFNFFEKCGNHGFAAFDKVKDISIGVEHDSGHFAFRVAPARTLQEFHQVLNIGRRFFSEGGGKGGDGDRFCRHCGRRVSSKFLGRGFCCEGCERVYDIIRGEGLSDFYGQGSTPAPVGERPLRNANFEWAGGVQASAESAGGSEAKAQLELSGMSCGGCVWLVERLARRQPGVREARASLFGQRIELRWRKGSFDLPGLLAELHRFGYDARRPAANGLRMDPLLVRGLLCAVFAVNLALLFAARRAVPGAAGTSALWEILPLFFLVLAAAVGGGYFGGVAGRELRARRFPADAPLLAAFGVLGVAGAVASFGGIDAPWAELGFALALTMGLLARKAQLAVLRSAGRKRPGATTGDSIGPGWMAAGFGVLTVGLVLRGGGALAILEGVAGGGLVLASFPLAAARELGARAIWRWISLILSFLGLALILTGRMNFWGALVWHAGAGILPCFGMAKTTARENSRD